MIDPDETYVNVSDVDWNALDPVKKRQFWRERKAEWLSSNHSSISAFLRSRGLENSQHWTKGWREEKDLVVRNAEMMVMRQTETYIADVIQLAYNTEAYAIASLAAKLKKEQQTMKVSDIIAIVHLMRMLQGKANSVETARSEKTAEDKVTVYDIDGQYVSTDD